MHNTIHYYLSKTIDSYFLLSAIKNIQTFIYFFLASVFICNVESNCSLSICLKIWTCSLLMSCHTYMYVHMLHVVAFNSTLWTSKIIFPFRCNLVHQQRLWIFFEYPKLFWKHATYERHSMDDKWTIFQRAQKCNHQRALRSTACCVPFVANNPCMGSNTCKSRLCRKEKNCRSLPEQIPVGMLEVAGRWKKLSGR